MSRVWWIAACVTPHLDLCSLPLCMHLWCGKLGWVGSVQTMMGRARETYASIAILTLNPKP